MTHHSTHHATLGHTPWQDGQSSTASEKKKKRKMPFEEERERCLKVVHALWWVACRGIHLGVGPF